LCSADKNCPTVAVHDSFLDDNDPFAQPELFTLIASAEGGNVILMFSLWLYELDAVLFEGDVDDNDAHLTRTHAIWSSNWHLFYHLQF